MAAITTIRPSFKTDLVLVAFMAVVAAAAADARGACPERIGRDIPATKSPERYVALSELAALNDEIDRSGHDVPAHCSWFIAALWFSSATSKAFRGTTASPRTRSPSRSSRRWLE